LVCFPAASCTAYFLPTLAATVTAPTLTSTLSLHDALPILPAHCGRRRPPTAPSSRRCRRDLPEQEPAMTEHVAITLVPTIVTRRDRKSTRLNSSHVSISYAVFCLKKKKHRVDSHVV